MFSTSPAFRRSRFTLRNVCAGALQAAAWLAFGLLGFASADRGQADGAPAPPATRTASQPGATPRGPGPAAMPLPAQGFGMDSALRRAITDPWMLDRRETWQRGPSERLAGVKEALLNAREQRAPGQTEVAVDLDRDGRPEWWVFFAADRPLAVEQDRYEIGVRDRRIDLVQQPGSTKDAVGWFVQPPAPVAAAVPALAVSELFDWAKPSSRAERLSGHYTRLAERVGLGGVEPLRQLAARSREQELVQTLEAYAQRTLDLASRVGTLPLDPQEPKARSGLLKTRTYEPLDLDGREGQELAVSRRDGRIVRVQFFSRHWLDGKGFQAEVILNRDQVEAIDLGRQTFVPLCGHWVRAHPEARRRIAASYLLPGFRHYGLNDWYAAVAHWRRGTQLAALLGDFPFNDRGELTGEPVRHARGAAPQSVLDDWDSQTEEAPVGALLKLAWNFSWQESFGMVPTLHDVAWHHQQRNDDRQALELYALSYRVAEKLQDASGQVNSLDWMSEIYRRLGQYDTAVEHLFRSLDLESSLAYALDMAQGLENLANDPSDPFEMQRVKATRSHAMSVNRGCKLATIAALCADLGDQPQAEGYLQEAERLFASLGHRYGEADLLALRASWELRAGRRQLALDRLARAQSVLQQQLAAQQACERGQELFRQGAAWHHFQVPGDPVCLKIDMRSPSHPISYLALTEGLMAEAYLREAHEAPDAEQRRQRLDRAAALQTAALEKYQTTEDLAGILQSRLRLASILAAGGDQDRVLALAAEVSRSAQEHHVFESHWRAIALQAAVHQSQGRRAAAIAGYEAAAAEIESRRASLHSERIRQGFFGTKQDVYEQLTLLYLADCEAAEGAEAEAEKVWRCLERSKARALLDLLGDRPLEIKGEEVVQARREFPLAFSAFRAPSAWSAPTAAQLGAREDLFRRFAATPAYQEVASLSAVQPVELTQLRQLLEDDDLLVEYGVTKSAVTAVVISSRDIRALRLTVPGRDDLQRSVSAFRQLVQDPASDVRAAGRTLCDQLLAPCLAGRGGVRHVCIVPGEILHYLPFDALVLPDGRFAAERWLLTYAPSASALVYACQRRRAATAAGDAQALVVADPRPRLDYGALAGAAVEGQRIYELAKGPRRLLQEDQATETALARELPRARCFHFAGHTDFSETFPLRTALLCTEDVDRDGRLDVQELFELNLPFCELAVLSACQTRLGRWSSGDEIVGLERAFLRAGVPSVVASLWKVDDAATSLLMEVFYRQLWQQGRPRGEALHQAKLALLQSPQDLLARRKELEKKIESQGDIERLLAARGVGLDKPRELPDPRPASAAAGRTHPAFWAAFTLSGDWR